MTETANAATDAHSDVPVKHEVYWRDTEPVRPGPPLREDVRCDVAVVGGGYTGMWTALFLKQADPSLEIHLLEADHAGAGASGHNDGFVSPAIGSSPGALIHRFGLERATLAHTVVGRSITELRRFCAEYDVDAELETTGQLRVAADRHQLRLLERDRDLLEQLDGRRSIERLGAADARERVDSPAIVGAFTTDGALLNPHKLARGLLRVVRELGVHVHESTPVTALRRAAGGHVLTTPYARVTAAKVLLATNAHQHRFAAFRRTVVPVWRYAAVTRPLTEPELKSVHWPDREGFVEAGNLAVVARLTADNRLLVGGGGADHSGHGHPSATAALRGVLARYFPRWRDIPFSHAYAGRVAVTRERVPHVGGTGDGIFYGYGYGGNEISVAHTAAKSLRDLILGRDSVYTNLLFVNGAEKRFPPAPFTLLGSRAVAGALAVQDRYPRLIRARIV
ncbi:FAD-dependent oxidoreductase [Actinophytocola sp.]|uniref:NAD(P)/FAD-dependent oxidoreductase n=1 Tax=Actinophytocola sp. TaxID=1872138 RepID=UPI002ED9313E